MIDHTIFHNDRLLPLEQTRLSPGQMGLFMGWGVFTTLRVSRGIPFALERHWARLERDAARLSVPLPCSLEDLRGALAKVIRANKRAEGVARVIMVRNTGELWADAPARPSTDLLIFTRALVSWPATQRLVLQPAGIFSSGPYAGAKMLSWIEHAGVLERARAQGFDEALLMNEKGELAECTSANIFLVRRGEVFTPPLASGCLPGVTREILLEIGAKSGVTLRQQTLTTDDLATADEVFISSTTREVVGVESISPLWKFPAPGELTLKLKGVFQAYAESYLAALPFPRRKLKPTARGRSKQK